jgi:hypothetical protein
MVCFGLQPDWVMPVKPRACVHNEYTAIMCRIVERGNQSAEYVFDAAYQAARQTFRDLLPEEQLRVRVWLHRFPANRRDHLRKMLDAGMPVDLTTRRDGRVRMLVKVEKTLKPPPFATRAIQAMSEAFQVLTGPPVLALEKTLAQQWDGVWRDGHAILFASGRDSVAMGAWHDEMRAHFDDPAAFEVDVSHADSHHGASSMALRLRLYADLGLDDGIAERMAACDYCAGTSRHGLHYFVLWRLASGKSETKLFNGLVFTAISLVPLLSVRFAMAVCGDNEYVMLERSDLDRMLDLVTSALLEAGYETKHHKGDTDMVPFCSACFVPADGGSVLTVLPGRFLAKAFYTIKGAADAVAWIKGAALNAIMAYAHVPAIAEAARVVASQVTRAARYASDELYRWMPSRVLRPQLELLTDWWQRRYGHPYELFHDSYMAIVRAYQGGVLTYFCPVCATVTRVDEVDGARPDEHPPLHVPPTGVKYLAYNPWIMPYVQVVVAPIVEELVLHAAAFVVGVPLAVGFFVAIEVYTRIGLFPLTERVLPTAFHIVKARWSLLARIIAHILYNCACFEYHRANHSAEPRFLASVVVSRATRYNQGMSIDPGGMSATGPEARVASRRARRSRRRVRPAAEVTVAVAQAPTQQAVRRRNRQRRRGKAGTALNVAQPVRGYFRYRSEGDQLVVEGMELIDELFNPTLSNIETRFVTMLNPLAVNIPRLSGICASFEEFRFDLVAVEYETAAPATRSGVVMAAVIDDPLARNPVGAAEFKGYETSLVGPISKNMSTKLEKEDQKRWWLVHPASEGAASATYRDPTTRFQGKVVVALGYQATADAGLIAGYLALKYRVRLKSLRPAFKQSFSLDNPYAKTFTSTDTGANGIPWGRLAQSTGDWGWQDSASQRDGFSTVEMYESWLATAGQYMLDWTIQLLGSAAEQKHALMPAKRTCALSAKRRGMWTDGLPAGTKLLLRDVAMQDDAALHARSGSVELSLAGVRFALRDCRERGYLTDAFWRKCELAPDAAGDFTVTVLAHDMVNSSTADTVASVLTAGGTGALRNSYSDKVTVGADSMCYAKCVCTSGESRALDTSLNDSDNAINMVLMVASEEV